MTISKRVLTKWRKEALVEISRKKDTCALYAGVATNLVHAYHRNIERVLLLTQELIDQELLKEANGGN